MPTYEVRLIQTRIAHRPGGDPYLLDSHSLVIHTSDLKLAERRLARLQKQGKNAVIVSILDPPPTLEGDAR